MHVEHDNSVDEIISEVSKLGYKAVLIRNDRQAQNSTSEKATYGSILLSGIFIILGLIGTYTEFFPLFSILLYASVIIICGYKPAKSVYYAIKKRSLDMNVLMTVAAMGAALIGVWLKGATVLWLFAFGTVLQNRSIERTRQSIRDLMDLAPSEAWVKTGDDLVKTPIEEISVGQTIVIKPGDRIPLVGKIVRGETTINQAPITGESIPVDKSKCSLIIYYIIGKCH